MPKVWVDRPDTTAGECCGDFVGLHESIGRLLNTEMWDPVNEVLTKASFPRDALEKPPHPENACGLRSGESVLRCDGVTAEELNSASLAQYAGKSKASAGAARAAALDVRAIREPGDDDTQIFYLYEDPLDELPGHAVVRFTDVPDKRTGFNVVRSRLLKAFTHD